MHTCDGGSVEVAISLHDENGCPVSQDGKVEVVLLEGRYAGGSESGVSGKIMCAGVAKVVVVVVLLLLPARVRCNPRRIRYGRV
eukprot:scaffold93089_cov16-Tisochrysis_lutea.AAC.1